MSEFADVCTSASEKELREILVNGYQEFAVVILDDSIILRSHSPAGCVVSRGDNVRVNKHFRGNNFPFRRWFFRVDLQNLAPCAL